MKSKILVIMSCIFSFAVISFLTFIYNSTSVDRENLSIFITFLALIAATFTFHKKETFNERLEVFLKGSSQTFVIHTCFMFFLTTIFTNILEHTGSIISMVNVCLNIFPIWFTLPGAFLGASFIAFTTGSSIITIAAFTPVAINVAHHFTINPSLMAATIVCGSMLGDNLSILSEATVLSVKIANTTMAKKFYLNLKIGFPAFIATIAILIYQNSFITRCGHLHGLENIHLYDLVNALPYIITFCFALTGLDMIFVIFLGIIIGICIGIYCHNFTLPMIINFMFDGFYHSRDIVNIFILIALLSGFVTVITYNGYVEYLITKIKNRCSNNRHAKFMLCFLVALVNIIVTIHSIAIITCGPAVSKISKECHIDPTETACILEIVSCALQGLLPYTPQLILAASITQVSTLSLLPYLYYQFLILLSLGVTIWNHDKKYFIKE